MKLSDKLFYGLLFVGVGLVIYNYKDKIFKKKDSKTNLSREETSDITIRKTIDTQNLDINSSPINYNPPKRTPEAQKKWDEQSALLSKGICPEGMLC